MVSISQVSAPKEIHDVQDLLREYTAWVFTLAAESNQAPTFQGLEEELATLPGIYAPPTGSLLLATLNSQSVGCIALKRHDATTGELKRLYIRQTFRGRKIGRQLVNAVIETSREMGYQRLILDSHISMKPAHAIYEAAGFRNVETPIDFPEDLKPIVVFMEMNLDKTE
jgi:GNAT superfamily N-acetyltransferase